MLPRGVGAAASEMLPGNGAVGQAASQCRVAALLVSAHLSLRFRVSCVVCIVNSSSVISGHACVSRDGGPRTQGSAPGAAGGPSGKRTAGRVQGFQLLQEQGRSRRRRSTCRGRDDGHGLALRHGLPLTESVLRAAAAARQTAGRFQSIPATRMRCRRTHAAAGTPTQHAACTCGV